MVLGAKLEAILWGLTVSFVFVLALQSVRFTTIRIHSNHPSAQIFKIIF